MVAGLSFAAPQSARAEEPISIVVEGERHPREAPRDDSVSAEVIPRERLGAPGLSAASALRGTPGVSVVELGGVGSGATASIRGATAAQTPVYLGGVRLNDEVGGSADLASVPLWFLERIEIYRGHTPVDADHFGPGGGLFFEPRRPDGKLTLGALAGSHRTRGAWTTASAGDASDGVIAGVGYEAAINDYGFEDDRGTIDSDDDVPGALANADAARLGLWLHARRRVGRALLGLLAHHGSLERGVARIANAPADRARERFVRDFAAISARAPLGTGDTWVDARTILLGSASELDDPRYELGTGASSVSVRGTRVNQSVALRLRPLPALLLRPAVDASAERLTRREANEQERGAVPVLDAARVDLRPSLFSELELGRGFALRAALALECSSATSSILELCTQHPLTGRIGPSLRRGSWTAYANLGRYARSPTLGERYGMSAVVRGEPNLEPELGETIDVGARLHEPRWLGFWASAAGFVRWADDLIVFTRTAQGYVVPENRNRARVTGLELGLGAAPLASLELDVGLTLTDARDTSPARRTVNDVLPFQPRLVFSSGISFARALDAGALDAVLVGARYVHQANRYADAAGLEVIPEQGALELSGEAELLQRALVVRLRLDNAIDQNRFDVVGFPLPGTSLYASLEARL